MKSPGAMLVPNLFRMLRFVSRFSQVLTVCVAAAEYTAGRFAVVVTARAARLVVVPAVGVVAALSELRCYNSEIRDFSSAAKLESRAK